MRSQALYITITIATGLVAGLLADSLSQQFDNWLAGHNFESGALLIKLGLIAVIVIAAYGATALYHARTLNHQRRVEALARIALYTVEYLRTRQFIINDQLPDGDISQIRTDGLSVPLSEIWRALTPVSAQLHVAIRQAYGFAKPEDVRVSVFIPRKVIDTEIEEDKGKLALFNGGSSYPESRSLTETYYFLPDHGFAGTCWSTSLTEIGGRCKRFLLWHLKGPHWPCAKDPRWVNMHERECKDHNFHQVACVPVRDRLQETTVVAVISLDSVYVGAFPHREPKMLVDAIQIASMAVADCVRMLYFR
jgi:hypothetical protein